MDTTDADRRSPYKGGHPGYQNRAARIAGTIFTAVWLLYLIGPVVHLFTGHYGALYRWGGLAIIVVFSAIYVILVPNWPKPYRYTMPGLGVLAALATLACVVYGGTGAVTLWIFMSSASGLLVRGRRWAVRAVTACIACYVIFSVTGHVGSTDFLSNLLPVMFIGFAMIGLRRQFQLVAELAMAREEVAQLAASEERLRLARDMHDLTGQSLSMITLKSELAARLLGRLPAGGDRDRVQDEVEQVAAVSRQTLRDIREAISGYRRPTLAVEIITARTALASAGIAARDEADLMVLSGTFDPDAEAALAWCLREAVTNVVRHSGATTCCIELTRRSGDMTLAVRDDGTGLAGRVPRQELAADPVGAPAARHPGTAGPGARVPHGSGLHGLSERLSAVGGTLELRPDLEPGFALIATVPTAPHAPAAPAGPAVVAEPAPPKKLLDRIEYARASRHVHDGRDGGK
jgi:two-component system, NarL family, sensor histidine kinase DesK